ncbi:E3 ubiquitin-protein ligase SIRP1 [Linum grandiflorum]
MEHYQSYDDQSGLNNHDDGDDPSNNTVIHPPAEINGADPSSTATSHLHAIFVVKCLRRHYLLSPDSNLTLLEENEFESPHRPRICLGPVGLFHDPRMKVVDRVAQFLTRFGWSDWFSYVLEKLTREVGKLTRSDREVHRCEFTMTLAADVVWDEAEYMEMVTEAEARQSNYGMVPTAEKAIGEMLATLEGQQEAATAAVCVICLEDLAAVAAEMPCRHRFHKGCIVNWLKQSHYCPICRFEMPREVEISDFSDDEGGEEGEDAVSTHC